MMQEYYIVRKEILITYDRSIVGIFEKNFKVSLMYQQKTRNIFKFIIK